MSRHSIRAAEFRLQAASAREKVAAAALPQVRSVLQHSADSWEAMAKREDAFAQAAEQRLTKLAAAA
jgi:hypothetical protein